MGEEMKRADRIQFAMREAKKRDGGRCRFCGRKPADAAHILPRNVGFPWYDPADPDWIIALCRQHHRSYDERHDIAGKYAWLVMRGLMAEALKLKEYV